MKNLERIQNLDAEKMAKLLVFPKCSFCLYEKPKCLALGISIQQCEDGIRKWLESEVR